MEQYEYILIGVASKQGLDDQGKNGWRVVPGILFGDDYPCVLMERPIQTEISYSGPCNASKGVGWGDRRTCMLEDGHAGEHRWGAMVNHE